MTSLRSRLTRVLAALGGTAAVVGVAAGLVLQPHSQPPVPQPRKAAPPASALAAAVQAAEARPSDPAVWSGLAVAYLNQARITLDSSLLDRAGDALHKSLELRGRDNYDAMTASGMLANARHEFADARSWGVRARDLAPDRPAAYAVLADADIQLGYYPAATAAAQRLLDLTPTVPAFTRAAYDLETHGRAQEAVVALNQAETTASTPGDIAFCEHRLGDLAMDAGDPATAFGHYQKAVMISSAVPDPYALAGRARAEGALGRVEAATRDFQAAVAATPLPQFLLEYGEWAASAGRQDLAGQQYAVLAGELRLAQAAGGPVDPFLALYAADHGTGDGGPQAAVTLMRGEWSRRKSVLVADALAWALHRTGADAEAIGYARLAAATGWRSPLFVRHREAIEQALAAPGRG